LCALCALGNSLNCSLVCLLSAARCLFCSADLLIGSSPRHMIGVSCSLVDLPMAAFLASSSVRSLRLTPTCHLSHCYTAAHGSLYANRFHLLCRALTRYWPGIDRSSLVERIAAWFSVPSRCSPVCPHRSIIALIAAPGSSASNTVCSSVVPMYFRTTLFSTPPRYRTAAAPTRPSSADPSVYSLTRDLSAHSSSTPRYRLL
jgi:hypothetical protein